MPNREALLEALAVPGDALNDLGYRLRYGLSPAEFQQRKTSGVVPGSVPNPGPERDAEEQRRTAAYYFARQWPRLAPKIQAAVNALKANPQLFGPAGPPNPFADEPGAASQLGAIASEASERGVADALKDEIKRAVDAARYAPRKEGEL